MHAFKYQILLQKKFCCTIIFNKKKLNNQIFLQFIVIGFIIEESRNIETIVQSCSIIIQLSIFLLFFPFFIFTKV